MKIFIFLIPLLVSMAYGITPTEERGSIRTVIPRSALSKIGYTLFCMIADFCSSKELSNFSVGNKKLNSLKNDYNSEILKSVFPDSPLIDLSAFFSSYKRLRSYVGSDKKLPISAPLTPLNDLFKNTEESLLKDRVIFLSQKHFKRFFERSICLEPLHFSFEDPLCAIGTSGYGFYRRIDGSDVSISVQQLFDLFETQRRVRYFWFKDARAMWPREKEVPRLKGLIPHLVMTPEDIRTASDRDKNRFGISFSPSSSTFRPVIDLRRGDGFVTSDGLLTLESLPSSKGIILTNIAQDIVGLQTPWGKSYEFEMRFSLEGAWRLPRILDSKNTRIFEFLGFSSSWYGSREEDLPPMILKKEDLQSKYPILSAWFRTFEEGDFPLKVRLAKKFLGTYGRRFDHEPYEKLGKTLLTRLVPLIVRDRGIHEDSVVLAERILNISRYPYEMGKEFNDELIKISIPLIDEETITVKQRKSLAFYLMQNTDNRRIQRIVTEKMIPLIGNKSDRSEGDVHIASWILDNPLLNDFHQQVARKAAFIHLGGFSDQNTKLLTQILNCAEDDVITTSNFNHNCLFNSGFINPYQNTCIDIKKRAKFFLAYSKRLVLNKLDYEDGCKWVGYNEEGWWSTMDPSTGKQVTAPQIKAQTRAGIALNLFSQRIEDPEFFNRLSKASFLLLDDGLLDWNVKLQTRAELAYYILSGEIEDRLRLTTSQKALEFIGMDGVSPEASAKLASRILERDICESPMRERMRIAGNHWSPDLTTSDIIASMTASAKLPEALDTIRREDIQKRAAEKAIRFLGSTEVPLDVSIGFAQNILKKRNILDDYFCWTVKNWLDGFILF